MRRKCYLPKSFEELKNLSDEKLQFYWDTFYTYPMIDYKAKLRPLWYAIQCELGRCRLPSKYITRLNRYASNPEKYIEHAHKSRYVLSVETLLTKKYKGKIYQVTVKGEQEYEWEGQIYPNLTVIASTISNIRKITLMADKLFDDKGNPYKLTSTRKQGQKYQYYCIRKGVHIPVIQLDDFVLDTIRRADLSSVDLQADSSQITSDEVKKCLKQVICVKNGTNCRLQIALDRMVFLDNCRQCQKQAEKINNPVLPEVGAETITIKDTFYIDNVTSTRLQHGTSQNILTVRQLREKYYSKTKMNKKMAILRREKIKLSTKKAP